MARIRRKNLLDISLNTIKDEGIRIAFERVKKFVSDLISHGFNTNGNIIANALELNDGGLFKTVIKTGSLGSQDNKQFQVQGKVVGAIGWSQYNATTRWEPISDGGTRAKVQFYQNNLSLVNTVCLYNYDAANANAYKLIIFYVD